MMRNKRFRTMREVDEYLEKEDCSDRYEVDIDIDMDKGIIVDNLTMKEYPFTYDTLNITLWEIISGLTEEIERQHEEIILSHKAFVECLYENKELKKQIEQLEEEYERQKLEIHNLRKWRKFLENELDCENGEFQVWQNPLFKKGERISINKEEF